MNHETLTRYLAEYTPAAIAKNEAGEIDREQTTEYVLGSIGNLCQRLAAVDGVHAHALAVCKYAATATTPAEKTTAENAAEALAALIEHNEMINAFAEPIEIMAQAAIKAAIKSNAGE